MGSDRQLAVRSEPTVAPDPDELCYESNGDSLHAATRFKAGDGVATITKLEDGAASEIAYFAS